MGGLLLLAAMVAVYTIIYWSIAIETYGNKDFGILGFKEGAEGSTHDLRQIRKNYLSHGNVYDSPAPSYKKRQQSAFLKSKQKYTSFPTAKASYLKDRT